MCTSFTIKKNSKLIFARNLDVDSDFGFVFINPRGISKIAYLPFGSKEVPAKWKSKYGSVTFNQICLDIPHGGMNEQGLVVEHLFLEESAFEPIDKRPALISHQWVQFVLDNYSDISELVKNQSAIRISKVNFKFPIHFHVMDKKGDRAVIEFIDEEIKVYTGNSYKIGVLSNNSYKESIEKAESKKVGFECEICPKKAIVSIQRFIKAADLVKNIPNFNISGLLRYCFASLNEVKDSTKWQILYNITEMEIHYRSESNESIKTILFDAFNFNTLQSVKAISIHNENVDLSEWQDFTKEMNSDLINTICNNSKFINSILGKEKEEIAVYPFRN